jgi:hypothetical protein
MKQTIIIPVCLILTAGISRSQTYSDITYDAGTTLEIQTGADVCATNIYINGTYSGGGTICDGPMPVTLSSFNASVSKNNVSLGWRTEMELNNFGFRIERMNIKESQWKEIAFVTGHGTTNEPKDYSFEDKKLQTGNYKYRLKQLDYNGSYEYFTLENDVIVGKPGSFKVSQNYPNPSNPKTRIDFELPFDGKVTLIIYDIIGREVVSILNETKEAGYYTAEFDGSNLASGMYFYRLIIEGEGQKFSKTMKMVLVK